MKILIPTVYVKKLKFRVAHLDVWSWLYGPPTKNIAHPWYRQFHKLLKTSTIFFRP